MPIRILSLLDKDLRYTLKCMDIGDLIVFSLCSKRTKSLVRSSNRKIEPISAEIYDNCALLVVISKTFREFPRHPPQRIRLLIFTDSQVKLERGNGFEVMRKHTFSQSDWVAHFLYIFNNSMIHQLGINDVCRIPYLDTVKQIIPIFNRLEISNLCSNDVAKMAFLKLSPIAIDEVVVGKNIFDNEKDVPNLLTRNLKSVSFIDWETPLNLKLDDLLVTNIGNLSVRKTLITEKELNRFVKLWLKGNQIFYRPKYIELLLMKEIDYEEVLKGTKYQSVNHNYQLARGDGKKMLISISFRSVVFEFQ